MKGPLLKSMTGFGQARGGAERCSYEVEVRSVNHRYLELSVRLPRPLASLEYDVRALVASRIRRGKVDIAVVRRPLAQAVPQSPFDQRAFDAYLAVYRRVIEEQGCDFEKVKEKAVLDVLSRGDVFPAGEESLDLDQEREALIPLIRSALEDLTQMREAEGTALMKDVLGRLAVLRSLQGRIRDASADLPARFRERIQNRVKRLESEMSLDENRLAMEIVLCADRADVTEELVRLESHFGQFEKAVNEEGQGRKLDFISQEFLREFNTIASKAQDAVIQALVVEAKTEIEKMKEQLQNIE